MTDLSLDRRMGLWQADDPRREDAETPALVRESPA